MSVTLSLFAGVGAQFFDNNGTVLSGGKIFSYAAGTTTPLATYTTNSESAFHTNPIILDSAGRVPSGGEIWLQLGIGYKFVLKSSTDVLIATYDNIPSSAQPPAANDADSIMYEQGYTVMAGSFVVGKIYRILTVGTTNFTLIGAINNTIGTHFIATGVGSGTGTAELSQTVETKLRQYVSVKDFGAVGDGVTNDLAAFVAAVAASNAVYVPPGTYLCNGGFNLKSNFKLYGDGSGSIIKWGANFSVILINNMSNVTVEDLLIDGGGQTTNIYTGVRGGAGVEIERSTNIKINRVIAQNMGIVNQADPFGVPPTYDGLYSGFGFIVSARTGPVSNVRITNCTALRIAGTGYQKGDGFYVAGYGTEASGTDSMDVVIDGCYASVCGRHGYTVSGGAGEDVPSGVIFNNCYAEKTGLDGLDIETGYDIVVNNCIWRDCGNDQTYYNPVGEYGATYRLLAAIAVDNDCKNIIINNNTFDACYYGFTYGASENVVISNCTFKNGTFEDIKQGLAAGVVNFKITNCDFQTPLDALQYYKETANSGLYVSGCQFAGRVLMLAVTGAVFDGCTFKRNIEFAGGASVSKLNTITNSVFKDFVGNSAITITNTQVDFANFVITNNVFRGEGNLVDGIRFPYQSALNWIISNNKFIGLTIGINILSGGGSHYCDVTGNNFESCSTGILVEDGIRQSLFANNSFGNISNWCIRLAGITSTFPMPNGPSIMNNMARNGCLNGVSIALTTGSYDYTMLVGNNVHACTGTKWSLAGGNANGVVANNITT
jgi:hypothetical protein